MKTLGAVKRVLEDEVQGCHCLLELLQRERLCLMDLQMEGVEAITKEKDLLVLKLRLLEEERIRLLDLFIQENPPAASIEKDPGRKITLRELSGLAGDQELMDIRSKLISLSQSIKELNAFNRLMIDRTLGLLKKNNSFLANFHPVGASSGKTGIFLSKEL
jgi:flagellar biosynthesis/type III secretory pathway chaperone